MNKSESKLDHEARKAKMRAYYQANKAKWKQYAKQARSKLTDSDRQKTRKYSLAHYSANRKRIIARTSEYQRKHAHRSKEYRAAWYQANKVRLRILRKKHYHQVVKARLAASKAAAKFITVTEAASLLGAKLRPFREFVYRGQIASVRSPGGRYLIPRHEIERVRDNIQHLPQRIRIQLRLSAKEKSK